MILISIKVYVHAIIIFILFSGERQVIINRDRRHIFLGTETLLKFKLHRDSNKLPAMLTR